MPRSGRLQFVLRSILLPIAICAWYFTCVRLIELGFGWSLALLFPTAVLIGALTSLSVARRYRYLNRRACVLAAGSGAAIAGIIQGFINNELFAHLYPFPQDAILIRPNTFQMAIYSLIGAIVAFVFGVLIGLFVTKNTYRRPT